MSVSARYKPGSQGPTPCPGPHDSRVAGGESHFCPLCQSLGSSFSPHASLSLGGGDEASLCLRSSKAPTCLSGKAKPLGLAPTPLCVLPPSFLFHRHPSCCPPPPSLWCEGGMGICSMPKNISSYVGSPPQRPRLCILCMGYFVESSQEPMRSAIFLLLEMRKRNSKK